MSVSNIKAEGDEDVSVNIRRSVGSVEARILTGDTVRSHNSFDREEVKPAEFDSIKKRDDGLDFSIPARSLIVLSIA